MAYVPISGIVPQLQRNAGGAAAGGYYLKGYISGGVTPLSMGIDSTPSATIAKCLLNSRGEPISNDADETTVFIPHFNAAYKLALYTNSTDADNNTIASAVWVVDAISGQFDASSLNYTASVTVEQKLNNLDVDNYAELRALTSTQLVDGDSIRVTDTGIAGIFIVKTGTKTDNAATRIVFTDDSNRYAERVYDGRIDVRWLGAVGDGVADDTTALQSACDLFSTVFVYLPAGHSFLVSATISITTQVTISGPDGGSQQMQHAEIIHDAGSTGNLFDVTTNVSGVSIKNIKITGGNGSFAIRSSNSYVNYEFLYFQLYNGGGIQLVDSGVGSSSSRIYRCEYVGPASATDYTGFEINVNGGDVHLDSCGAIRGAIGIDVVKGQTIAIESCSVNKQSISNGFSSAALADTCGIKLSGTSDFKMAISIRNSYIEASSNGIYVEKCESLSIVDCLLQDNGVGGFPNVGGDGGHLINLAGGADVQNVNIQNNRMNGSSNGTSGVNYFAIKVSSGVDDVSIHDNIIITEGDYATQFDVSQKIFWANNNLTNSSNPGTRVGEELLMGIYGDYDEDTYTATLTPITSGTITLDSTADLISYTRIGRTMKFSGSVTVSSVSSPVGAVVQLSLPQAAGTGLSERADYSTASVSALTGGTWSPKAARIIAGESSMRIHINASTIVASDEIYVCGEYIID
jgi:hypothetical protein